MDNHHYTVWKWVYKSSSQPQTWLFNYTRLSPLVLGQDEQEGGQLSSPRVPEDPAATACCRGGSKGAIWVTKRFLALDLEEQTSILMGYDTNFSHTSTFASRTQPLWALCVCAKILAIITPEINPCISKQKLLIVCNAFEHVLTEQRFWLIVGGLDSQHKVNLKVLNHT